MAVSPDLISRLNLNGKPLSKSHRRIAAYIGQHYEKAVFLTASALAEAAGVSESTVIRFAMNMGYPGYPELREALGGLVRQRLTSEQRFEIAAGIDQSDLPATVLRNDERNIRRTMENLSRADFDAAVESLLAARRVYVLGLRSAAPLAQFLYLYLHQILDDVVLVQNAVGDVFEEIARIGEGDMLVGISYPRYSTRTLESLRFAREKGARTLALTDSELSPLREAADLCLCAATDMASFVDSLAAPMSLVNALVVSLGLHRRGMMAEHFRQLEEIWNAHSVYINKTDE